MPRAKLKKYFEDNKIFLLVFHGGLVCYLLLHNLAMPLVKNIGQKNPLFEEIQFYFIPQLILFLFFLKTNLKEKKENFIPFIISFNFSILLFSIFILFRSLQDGISRYEFSIVISMVSISIFFLVFFLRFRRFFLWSFPKVKAQYFIGLLLGYVFVLILPITERQEESRPIEVIREKKFLETKYQLTLPTNPEVSNKIAFLTYDNFKPKFVTIHSNSHLTILNQSGEKQVIRLEYHRNDKWFFKRVYNLSKNKNIVLDNLENKKIYRLRSSNNKKLGSFYIIKGVELFIPGNYILSEKGLEEVI